ncbi:hypothetical protein ACE1CD_32145 [Aerosakkonema sp. BLCC-F183]
MNEQRRQAYLALIQELLSCPCREKNQLLTRFLDLKTLLRVRCT